METLSTKVPADLREQVTDFADRHDLSISNGTRRLLRAGLEAETEPPGIPAGHFLAMFGAFLAGAGIGRVPDSYGLLGIAMFAVGLLAHHPRVTGRVERLKRRYTSE